MSRKAVFPALLLFFLLTVNAQFTKAARASRTWAVDDDGPADFHTVQEAVDVASDGDIVFVRNGIYQEHVFVNKAISLVGENAFGTIIDAQGRSINVISVEADNVTVSSLTLRNSSASWSTILRAGGVGLYSSNGCNIKNCISINNHKGVNLLGSSYNNISSNIMTGNIAGIVMWNSSNSNLIKGNWVLNNSVHGDGICIESNSNNNTIVENYFCNNSLFVQSLTSGTVVCRNNFLSNTPIKIVGSPNVTLDHKGEGNFWINYTGVDTNGDGIGDTPFIIDESNEDNYPLMRPYGWIQGDINYDTIVNIVDIAILANAFGSHVGDIRWNPRCDLNNDKNINMLDIVAATSNFGKRMNNPFRMS